MELILFYGIPNPRSLSASIVVKSYICTVLMEGFQLIHESLRGGHPTHIRLTDHSFSKIQALPQSFINFVISSFYMLNPL